MNKKLFIILFLSFLITIGGFDTVDDESEYEFLTVQGLLTHPIDYNSTENPCYVYYLYYLYANISYLNILRKSLGLNTF